MADLQYAGEFDLEKCELISSAGVTVDISAIIVEISWSRIYFFKNHNAWPI